VSAQGFLPSNTEELNKLASDGAADILSVVWLNKRQDSLRHLHLFPV
jgi:hypothetical protein